MEEFVSFANTKGGDLFFGVDEKDGGIIDLNGVDEAPDKMLRSIKQMIENNTDPMLINVLHCHIPLTNGKHVFFGCHIRTSLK